MVVETHVTQHHDGAEQQRGGVSQVHASNIGGGAMNLQAATTDLVRLHDNTDLDFSQTSIVLSVSAVNLQQCRSL